MCLVTTTTVRCSWISSSNTLFLLCHILRQLDNTRATSTPCTCKQKLRQSTAMDQTYLLPCLNYHADLMIYFMHTNFIGNLNTVTCINSWCWTFIGVCLLLSICNCMITSFCQSPQQETYITCGSDIFVQRQYWYNDFCIANFVSCFSLSGP